MFARKTTFIVGAGASHEFDLPVGETLKDRIVAALPSTRKELGSDTFHRALMTHMSADLDGMLGACRAIRRGLPLATSIDRFMDYHQDDSAILSVGKLAIAWCILGAERNSKLYHRPSGGMNINNIKETWIVQLFKYMQEGARRGDLGDILKNVTFITFNYDRCIEHFFYNALIDFSGCTPKSAALAMNNLSVLHPYGKLGSLSWEVNPSGPELTFGEREDFSNQLIPVSKQIKTFAEQISEDDSTLNAVRVAVKTSKQIVFVGFSYLDQNMKYLTPVGRVNLDRYPYATTYGESEVNANIANGLIRTMLTGQSGGDLSHQEPRMLNMKACDLIRDFGNLLRS